MRLLKEELAKIWQPRLVAAIVALGVLFYLLFSAHWVQYFHGGPFNKADFDLSVGWMSEFGATIDDSERLLLDEQLARERELFDAQIIDIPEAAEAGIDEYADLLALRNLTFDENGRAQTDGALASLTEEETSKILISFSAIDDKTNYPVIQQLEQFIEGYDYYASSEGALSAEELALYTGAAQARIAELNRATESGVGYLPLGTFDSTMSYAKWLAVWTVLSVIMLLSPAVVRDRIHRVQALQWASRTGRQAESVQLLAGLLSALALTCINIATYAIPFLANNPLALANAPLHSPISISMVRLPWFDLTYGEYLLALVSFVLALGVSAGAFALMLSRISNTYISMLFKTLPLFVALGALFASWLFETPLFFKELFIGSGIWMPKGADVASIAAVFAASLVLCAVACYRIRKRELLR